MFSVIIPAKNESSRLPPTLEKVARYFAGRGGDWELLVVDNGSRDDTPRLVEEFSRAHPQVRLLQEPAPGKGAALRTGMLAAAGELVLFSDADLSCPIEEEARLREALEKGYDVAIASRRLPGSQVEKSLRRKMMSVLFNWAVQLLALPGIKDSQCGFKLFRREAARRLFGAGAVDGWAFDVEILFLARRLGYKIREVPVSWQESEGTRVEALRDALRMLRDIVQFRLAWQRGEYKSRLERES
jgi:dolichyl-phosphate beta-glucosyltransferase